MSWEVYEDPDDGYRRIEDLLDNGWWDHEQVGEVTERIKRMRALFDITAGDVVAAHFIMLCVEAGVIQDLADPEVVWARTLLKEPGPTSLSP